ncbi:hypothetical protein D9M68_527240 [compost metagenome]
MSRTTSGSNGLSPSGSSRPVAPSPVCCRSWVTSRVKPGVRKTTPGKWVAWVLAMISLLKELPSSSALKFSPAVRSR